MDIRAGTQFQVTSRFSGLFVFFLFGFFFASQLDEICKLRLVLKHKGAKAEKISAYVL